MKKIFYDRKNSIINYCNGKIVLDLGCTQHKMMGKEVKEENVEIPESVRLGEEIFTEADFNKLIGSFIVVIPVMSYFQINRIKNGDWKAEIETSFTFINVDNYLTFAHFKVKTVGTDKTPRSAVEEASNNISTQLVYELRSIDEFTIKTGIIEVKRSEVLIEFGDNMGVKKGDEYAIISSRILASGHNLSEETGLLVIKEVTDEISYGKIIYSKDKPMAGDQLKEIPRLGFDVSVYAHGIYNSEGSGTAVIIPTVGIRSIASRGFFSFRPGFGIELPFSQNLFTSDGLPVNVYLGGELDWYLWKLQIVPMAFAGVGGIIPLDQNEDFILSHAGGMVQASISYLVTRDIKIFIEVGYTFWTGLSAVDTYGGICSGLGGTYKM